MISKRLLGFLIPAFIASLIYGYLQMPQQERISAGDDKVKQSSQAKKKQQAEKANAIGNEGYPRLRSDLLERKSQPYTGVRRDLFFAAFVAGQSKEEIVVLPEEPPEVIVPPVVVAVDPPPPPPPPPSPQEVARQEISRYKFIGFFKKGGKQTIFLSTAGEVFLVRKGDYLGRDRNYYVLNITDTTMELRKDGAGDFLIKLTDQESLSAVSLQEQRKSEWAPASSRAVQPSASGTPGREMQGQEMNLPDHPPELVPVPDEEPPTEDQLQPEEDNK